MLASLCPHATLDDSSASGSGLRRRSRQVDNIPSVAQQSENRGTPDLDETDKRLIARGHSGDRAAREELLVRSIARLRGFIRLRLGGRLRVHEESEDLVQSVCREVLEDLPNVQVDTDSAFRHWMFRAAERKLADRGRFWGRAKRDDKAAQLSDSDARELVDGYASMCTPSQNLEASEQLACIERAFEELPASYREIIVLARIEGLATETLASEIGQSPAYTRTLLSRALARMATLLERNSG